MTIHSKCGTQRANHYLNYSQVTLKILTIEPTVRLAIYNIVLMVRARRDVANKKELPLLFKQQFPGLSLEMVEVVQRYEKANALRLIYDLAKLAGVKIIIPAVAPAPSVPPVSPVEGGAGGKVSAEGNEVRSLDQGSFTVEAEGGKTTIVID